MHVGDHEPPHFHAECAEDQAVIGIETLAVIGGPWRILDGPDAMEPRDLAEALQFQMVE